MSKKLYYLFVFVVLTFIISYVSYLAGLFTFLENKTFDYRAKIAAASTVHHSDIVLVLIDENSLDVMDPLLGRWPWPRYIYHDFLSFMALAQAKGPRDYITEINVTSPTCLRELDRLYDLALAEKCIDALQKKINSKPAA